MISQYASTICPAPRPCGRTLKPQPVRSSCQSRFPSGASALRLPDQAPRVFDQVLPRPGKREHSNERNWFMAAAAWGSSRTGSRSLLRNNDRPAAVSQFIRNIRREKSLLNQGG